MKAIDSREWEIIATKYTHNDILQNGNKMLFGNGYMGVRGTVDEAGKEDMASIIVNGIYDQQGEKWREPVTIPNPLCVHITLADSKKIFSLHDKDVVSHEQKLNFKYGLFERKTTWDKKGTKITVHSKRFVSMSIQHLLCLEYSIVVDKDISLCIIPLINTDVFNCNGPHFSLDETGTDPTNKITIFNFKTLELQTPFTVGQYVFGQSKNKNIQDEPVLLKKNKAYTFYIYGALFCGIDYDKQDASFSDKIKKDTIRCLSCLENESFDKLYEAHQKKWNEIWKDGDVVIEGDEKAQQEVRYNLYQLQSIAPRGNKDLSIPARGLSGQTYKGAVFWDTEIFIMPYFLYTNPAVAKNFIRYRIKTLSGALRKAKAYGYEGAFYAWESQENGDDACSDYNVTDVFTKRPMRTYFRDKQIHISSAVVFALREYIEVTNDYSLLLEGGLEVLMECALFYLSRCVYVPLKDRYEVHDVIGPDEYHERINNNAYTNRMIKFTLETALKYLHELESDNNTFFQEIVSKNNFIEYIPQLEKVCKKLYVPQPNDSASDATKKVIEQFDGYFLLENCTLSDVKNRLLDPKEYWGGSNGVASQTQIIKQADVVLMLNLFEDEYTKQVKKANYDYYEQRTEHGSSLSSCMYGLLACRIDDLNDAYKFFAKTAEVDLSGDSKQFAGLIYIGGTHPAAQGGTWMMVVQGFCGFSCKNGKIKVMPNLPKTWNKVVFTVMVQKKKYEITVDKKGSTICQK